MKQGDFLGVKDLREGGINRDELWAVSQQAEAVLSGM